MPKRHLLTVSDTVAVSLAEFDFVFARSGGPGGQNVNKLNTKVTLRWNVAASPSLPADVRTRFCSTYRRRITKEGVFVLHSQRFRDQGRNVGDCLEKLRAMLLDVAQAPTKRKPTRRTRASVERRLREKQESSQKKRFRKKPSLDD